MQTYNVTRVLGEDKVEILDKYLRERLFHDRMNFFGLLIPSFVFLMILLLSCKAVYIDDESLFKETAGFLGAYSCHLIDMVGSVAILMLNVPGIFKHASMIVLKCRILHALSELDYRISTCTVTSKIDGENKAPFYVNVMPAIRCECPVFLDYRDAVPGGEMVYIEACDYYYAFSITDRV